MVRFHAPPLMTTGVSAPRTGEKPSIGILSRPPLIMLAVRLSAVGEMRVADREHHRSGAAATVLGRARREPS